MTSNEMAAVPTTTADLNMSLTQIRFRCWTGESQVSKEDAAKLLGMANDDDNYKVVKKLLDQDILRYIKSIQGHCKRKVEKLCLRFPLDNVIAVPTKAREEVEAIVGDYQKRVEAAVDILIYGGTFQLTQKKSKTIQGYQSLKQEAKYKLGDAYRSKDYPPEERLRDKFQIQFMPWFDLSSSSGTNAGGMSAILDQFKDEATAALKAEFFGLIKHIVEKLEDKYDEKTGSMKRQVLHTSMLTKLKHFLDWVNDLNVGNDAALNALVGKCKKAIYDTNLVWKSDKLTDPEIDSAMDCLKKSDTFRASVRSAFMDLKDQFHAEDAGSDIEVKKKAEMPDLDEPIEEPVDSAVSFTIKKKANLPG